MIDVQLNTPTLFLIFNHPNTTAQVFETIRQAKPPRLYIAADGPRSNKPGETEKWGIASIGRGILRETNRLINAENFF